ncbi:VWA domain-containing protein [Formosa sediminum]|uniref:VWA domain-containing protein n=1 Tax=Formosa sediminum TaxID=2594004 RepID=A0A516GU00_9FLAO|nr:VWA domain-containing protein [Formosa sediminum]QDO95002.1 VWA domain-containing protein [Formosa sediminum]
MPTQTLLYIILAGILALILALFQYKYKVKSMSKLYMLFAFLRFISIFLILLLLINPKFEQLKLTEEKPKLLVAIDNSSSTTQLEQDKNAKQVLQTIQSHTALNTKFDIEYFKFGKTLNALDTLTFTDKQTDVAAALDGLKSIYKNTIAPTILVTDGNQTLGSDYAYTSYNQPVYPIILGDTTTYIDLSITQLNVNKYAYLKNKFPVETVLVYNGKAPVNTTFSITSGTQTIFSKNITFSATHNSEILQFTLPASHVGVTTYKAILQPLESEKNKVNNVKHFAVEVIDEKMNIAIVSSFYHPDLGTLKKSIESNEQRAVSILNPNEVNPKLNDFNLLILYQPDNQFKSIFEAIKADNKNAFIISGAQTDWFFLNDQSDYYEHDITSQTEMYQGVFNSNYTTFIVDNLDFNSFPPLQSAFGELSFYGPHEILLYKKIGNITTNQPLLATFETQGRREAVLLGENIWQWRAQSYLNKKSFNTFDNFISKVVQYLSSTKRKTRLVVDFESFYDGTNNVIIRAQFFNKNYEFDGREPLKIKLVNRETKAVTELPFVLKNNNYQVDLSQLPAAEYNFTVSATNENISQSGSFTILEYNVEQQFLNANSGKLNQLAQKTEGASYFIADYKSLLKDLLSNQKYVTIQKSSKTTQGLIDWKYMLGIIVFCLSLEWFLRKYNGLT